jgi:VanZ family protein
MQKHKITKLSLIQLLSLLLVILWMIIVYALSSLPSGESSNQSSSVISYIINLFSNLSNMNDTDKYAIIQNLQFIVRKLAHFLLYTVGGISLLNFAYFYDKIKRKMSFTVIVGMAYSLSDEIHQLFVVGRSCQITDVVIDTVGVIFGVIILTGIVKIVDGGKNENKKLSNF